MAFFKQIDDVVYFNGDGELIYYVPEQYFSSKNAVIVGEYVDLMGVISYDVFSSTGKSSGIKLINHPSSFRCKPHEITKEQNYLLKGTTEPTAYRLLHFKKDDELICSTRTVKGIENVERFVSLLIHAHLPDNIPYKEIHEYIIKNAEMNKFNYKVSSQILGIVISKLYRDSKNLNTPYRLTDMKSPYKAIGIKKIPKYDSPYISITSENADDAIANAMLNKTSKESPLEKVMMN